MDGEQIYGTIDDTCARYGIRTSKLYELLGAKAVVAKKFGKRLLIDLRSADKYFDGLPDAEIKPSRRALERAQARAATEKQDS
jgi:hypothetical protein